MSEGMLGGILGDEDEKREVEAPDALAGAEAFASAVAAKLAGNDPEVARKTVEFLGKQSQLLDTPDEYDCKPVQISAIQPTPGMPWSVSRCTAQPGPVPAHGECISKCLPDRARRREKAGTQPCARRSLRLKAFVSKRFGLPLFSPSIRAERITSICAPRSCSRRMRSRMYSLSLV
jgi:hypothetical protein